MHKMRKIKHLDKKAKRQAKKGALEENEAAKQEIRELGKEGVMAKEENQKKEGGKKVFEFFHGLGLIKTKEEREAIGRQKELEEKRKGKKIKSEEEFRELEKQIRELGNVFGEKKEKTEVVKEKEAEEKPEKRSLFSRLFEKNEEAIKAKEYIEKKEAIKNIEEELEKSLKGFGNVLERKRKLLRKK